MKKIIIAGIITLLLSCNVLAQDPNGCNMQYYFAGIVGTSNNDNVTFAWDQPTEYCDGSALNNGEFFYTYTGADTNQLIRYDTNQWNNVMSTMPLNKDEITYFGVSAISVDSEESGIIIVGIQHRTKPKPPTLLEFLGFVSLLRGL